MTPDKITAWAVAVIASGWLAWLVWTGYRHHRWLKSLTPEARKALDAEGQRDPTAWGSSTLRKALRDVASMPGDDQSSPSRKSD